jgi:hypothetical protein
MNNEGALYYNTNIELITELFPIFTLAIENHKLIVKSELVSYSNCHSKQNNFVTKPTVLAAK